MAFIKSYKVVAVSLLSLFLTANSTHAAVSQPPASDPTAQASESSLQRNADVKQIQKIEDLPLSDVVENPIFVTRSDPNPQVRIDGSIDEEIWRNIPPHTRFVITDPDTLETATLRTEVRLFYNDDGLYLSADMEQDPSTLVKRLSARDESYSTRDAFMFNLDTSGEGRYGFWFQLSLGNAKSDGTIQPERQFSQNWDGAWYGATQETANGWSAEFYIPWSLVAMPKVAGQRRMGIYMSRKVATIDQRHGWPGLSYSQPKFLSAFQPLLFERVNPRRQLTFFPYVSSQYDSLSKDSKQRLGSDIFWRPSTNFQTTATIRPDFGTVEADSVIVNLTAIETFYPEKRLFFLEGQDIFTATDRASGWTSNTRVTLLHTRRIGDRVVRQGLPTDVQFDTGDLRRPAELLGAAKATGTSGNLSYGVFLAEEDDAVLHGTRDGEPVAVTQAGRGFSVVRGLWEKSNGGYRGIGLLSTKMSHPTGDAQTYGIDTHFFGRDGKLKIDSQVVMSDIPNRQNGVGGLVDIQYVPSRGVSHEFIVEDFDDSIDLSHMGYLGRNDFRTIKYRFRLRKANGGTFRERSTRVSIGNSWNGDSESISKGIFVSQELTLQNLAQFRVTSGYQPTQYDDRNSFGNGSFQLGSTKQLELRYRSDSAKRLYYSFSGSWREETTYGAQRSSSLSLVVRPSDRFYMYMNLSYIDRDAWLLYRGDRKFTAFESESWSPRIALNYFIAANQYVRFDLEWRGIRSTESMLYRLPSGNKVLRSMTSNPATRLDEFAISRMNVQLRYRWELAPMSDLFVVYTKAANLPEALGKSFADQFTSTFGHATSEGLIVKLRHRIGA